MSKYWHSYEFRHMLRGIASRYPKTYQKVGRQLEENGIYVYREVLGKTEWALKREFFAIISVMPADVIPYAEMGDTRQWKEFDWYKTYKYIFKEEEPDVPRELLTEDQKFEIDSKYAINGDECH